MGAFDAPAFDAVTFDVNGAAAVVSPPAIAAVAASPVKIVRTVQSVPTNMGFKTE